MLSTSNKTIEIFCTLPRSISECNTWTQKMPAWNQYVTVRLFPQSWVLLHCFNTKQPCTLSGNHLDKSFALWALRDMLGSVQNTDAFNFRLSLRWLFRSGTFHKTSTFLMLKRCICLFHIWTNSSKQLNNINPMSPCAKENKKCAWWKHKCSQLQLWWLIKNDNDGFECVCMTIVCNHQGPTFGKTCCKTSLFFHFRVSKTQDASLKLVRAQVKR